jgi:hypothetical protein
LQVFAESRLIDHLSDSRKAAKVAHPDVGGSEEKMAALNEAYEVLSNEGESRLRVRLLCAFH